MTNHLCLFANETNHFFMDCRNEMSTSHDDQTEYKNDLNDDVLLKIANFDLHSAGAFACLNKEWRDKMRTKLDVAKAFQIRIVREWKEMARFTNMAKDLKSLHEAANPFRIRRKDAVENIEAEPVRFMECWWEYDRESRRSHKYLLAILMRALSGLYVAVAICSIEKLDRCNEVCSSVFETSTELLRVCGIEYIPDKRSFDNLLHKLAKLKKEKERGGYRSFYFDMGDSAESMRFDWKGFNRYGNRDQALTPVFYRLLAVWKTRLPNPVLALVAHASAAFISP